MGCSATRPEEGKVAPFCRRRKHHPTSPPLMWLAADGKRAQRVEAGGNKLPHSPTPSPKSAESMHPPGPQSALAAAGPSRPWAPGPGVAEPGAGWTAGRAGRGAPTLSSTKSPSRGRRRRPQRVLVGRCPIVARPGTQRDGGAAGPRRRLTMDGELGLQLRPWAPRQLPEGACCSRSGLLAAALLPRMAPGVLPEPAGRCCS